MGQEGSQMVLSRVGEFRELGEGTSYCLGLLSQKNLYVRSAVWNVDMYAYIKFHIHSRWLPLPPTKPSIFILFILLLHIQTGQIVKSHQTGWHEWKLGSDEKIEGKGQQKEGWKSRVGAEWRNKWVSGCHYLKGLDKVLVRDSMGSRRWGHRNLIWAERLSQLPTCWSSGKWSKTSQAVVYTHTHTHRVM